MADAVSEAIQAALNKIVTTTDQSANMKKDLKKAIFQTVSNLRKLFTELMGIIDNKTRLIKYSEAENNEVKAELVACRREVAKARTETLPSGKNQQDPATDRCCHLTMVHRSFTQ